MRLQQPARGESGIVLAGAIVIVHVFPVVASTALARLFPARAARAKYVLMTRTGWEQWRAGMRLVVAVMGIIMLAAIAFVPAG